MAFGNRTSTTCAIGSSFSLPPSAVDHHGGRLALPESAEPGLFHRVLLLQRGELRLERFHLRPLG